MFRFNLLPEPFSGLKKITQSVLKTRSTLSIYRVYKYLAKRLINDMNLLPPEFPEAIIDHDEFVVKLNIEIHCQGVALQPHLQLKQVFDTYWKSDELLTLYYRNKPEEIKDTIFDKEIINCPRKPPIWVPNKIAFTCFKWDKDFSFLLRVHHCRCCGKPFWYKWSRHKICLPQFGYFEPVRVCTECYWINNQNIFEGLSESDSHRDPHSMIFEAIAELSVPLNAISPQPPRIRI